MLATISWNKEATIITFPRSSRYACLPGKTWVQMR